MSADAPPPDILADFLLINREIVEEQDIQKLLARIMDSAMRIVNAERGFVVLNENDQWGFAFARNYDKEQVERPEYELSKTVVQKVLASGRPAAFARGASPAAFRESDSIVTLGVLSVACVPLAVHGQVLGVVYMDSRSPDRPVELDRMSYLEAYAGQAAIAIQNARLRQQVVQDKLTGLMTNAYFQARLAEEMDRARRGKHRVAVMMIDVDQFKQINDTHGHPVGDRVLREVAQTLYRNLRTSDVVDRRTSEGGGLSALGRFGGDEFEIMFSPIQIADTERIARRLLEQVRAIRVPLERGEARVTVSIGAGFSPEDGDTAEAVFQRADEALYCAKRAGRDRFHHFHAAPTTPAAG